MKNKKQLLIFIVCYIAYTSIYVARLNLSVASPGMKEAGIIDSAQIGMLGSVFSIIYAFGRFINGGISDRKPPWIMISTGLLIAGISNICIGFFPPFIGIMILWMANGFAQSMLWSSVLCVVSSLYEEQKAKKMTSYMVTSVAVGNIIGIVLNTYIITKVGLNLAFIIPGGITLIMSTAVALTTGRIKAPEAKQTKHISIKKLLLHKEVSIMVFPAMLHGVIKDNISVWMTVYFIDRFNVNLGKMALFVLFVPIVGLIGRIIYPLCYKLCGEREHMVSVFAFILCAISAVPLAMDFINPVGAAFCLALIYAFVSVINTSILSIFPIRFIKTGNVASVSGIMDFATYFGAGIGSFVYGFMIKSFGYTPMYASWVIICLVSVILLKPLLSKTAD